LECFDEKVPLCVGGDKGLTKSINCTVNLANLAHYDCNDEGVGVGVWFEKEKHLGTEVFCDAQCDGHRKNGRTVWK